MLIQDAKNNVDADLVMLEELKVKCRTQTEQIMAWKKAYSMQVIEFYFSWRKQTKWKEKKNQFHNIRAEWVSELKFHN